MRSAELAVLGPHIFPQGCEGVIGLEDDGDTTVVHLVVQQIDQPSEEAGSGDDRMPVGRTLSQLAISLVDAHNSWCVPACLPRSSAGPPRSLCA